MSIGDFKWDLRSIIICLFSMLMAVLYNYPQGFQFNGEYDLKHYTVVSRQADDLFRKENFATDSHEDKMKYRLTAPLVARFSPAKDVHSRVKFLLIAMGMMGIISFAVLFSFLSRNFSDGLTRDFLALILPFSYFHYAFFGDYLGMFDAFAYTGILVAFVSKNFFLRFLSMSIALWTDERSLASGLMLIMGDFLFHSGTLQQKWKSSSGILLALLLYVPMRIWLHFQIFNQDFNDVGGIGANEVQINLRHFDVTLLWTYFAFCGLWLFIPLASAWLWKQRNYGKSLVILVCLFTYFSATLMVRDLSRTATYLLPLLLLAMEISGDFFKTIDIRSGRKWAFTALAFSLLIAMLWKFVPAIFPSPYDL